MVEKTVDTESNDHWFMFERKPGEVTLINVLTDTFTNVAVKTYKTEYELKILSVLLKRAPELIGSTLYSKDKEREELEKDIKNALHGLNGELLGAMEFEVAEINKYRGLKGFQRK